MNFVDKIQAWMILASFLAVAALIAVVRGTAKATGKARQISRMSGTTVRVLLTTAVLVGAQWLLIAHTTDWRVIAAVLAVPAFVTATRLVRALTVTTTEVPTVKGGRR